MYEMPILSNAALHISRFAKKQGRILMSRFIRHTGFLAGFSLALLAFAGRSLAEPPPASRRRTSLSPQAMQILSV